MVFTDRSPMDFTYYNTLLHITFFYLSLLPFIFNVYGLSEIFIHVSTNFDKGAVSPRQIRRGCSLAASSSAAYRPLKVINKISGAPSG